MTETRLPAGWVLSTIEEITEPVSKVDPSARPAEEFTYLDISSIDNKQNRIVEPKHYLGADAPSRARQQVQWNDVLFSTVRTYLKNIALVPEKYDGQIASTGFCVLRGRKGVILGPYLFYYTLTADFLEKLSALQRGVSYPAVRDQDVRAQTIPVAPLREQQRIVDAIESLFSRLDAAVAALQRVQANLKRYRAAVLKAACEGRLVPTEAELARAEGRPYEPASVLLERILAERRAQWQAANPRKKYKEPSPPDTSTLPELPEGWCWASVEQLGYVQLGRQRSPRNHQGPYMRPYLRAANATWDGVDLSDVMEMNFPPPDFERYKLHDNDILLSEASGSADEVGKPFIWRGQIADCCFQNTLIRVQVLPEYVHALYLLLHFRKDALTGRFATVAKGVGIHHLGAQRLASMPVALPPLAEQLRIADEGERLLSVSATTEAALELNLQRAARLRQAILQRAFEGKLVPQDPADAPIHASDPAAQDVQPAQMPLLP